MAHIGVIQGLHRDILGFSGVLNGYVGSYRNMWWKQRTA